MEYVISGATDIGIVKETNQDSFGVKMLDTRIGKAVMAVLCDGMGGLAKGEVASATVVDAFNKWVLNRFPDLCETGVSDSIVKKEWTDIVLECNRKIAAYGKKYGIDLGTTAVAMLITETRYFIMNIGDSRAYEITDTALQLTKDQTLVAKEVEAGLLTPQQAENDERRSILLQCIGASEKIIPDMFFGETKKDAVYMLCSDGFRHNVSNDEISEHLAPDKMYEPIQMRENMETLIELNKQRQERDNISVVAVRTY